MVTVFAQKTFCLKSSSVHNDVETLLSSSYCKINKTGASLIYRMENMNCIHHTFLCFQRMWYKSVTGMNPYKRFLVTQHFFQSVRQFFFLYVRSFF